MKKHSKKLSKNFIENFTENLIEKTVRFPMRCDIFFEKFSISFSKRFSMVFFDKVFKKILDERGLAGWAGSLSWPVSYRSRSQASTEAGAPGTSFTASQGECQTPSPHGGGVSAWEALSEATPAKENDRARNIKKIKFFSFCTQRTA